MREFYIGYLTSAPSGLRRRMRISAAALLLLAAGVAGILTRGQSAGSAGVFEFGITRSFAGLIREGPLPRLIAPDGTSYLLVAPGKWGAGELVRGFDGSSVALRGTLIHRDAQQMIQIEPGTIRFAGKAKAAEPPTILAMTDLTGEIVDTKCYLGVMNPGNGKVHRSCAARCLSGGVPPALLVRDSSGKTMLVLIKADRADILRYPGERVRVNGQLNRLESGDLVLFVQPGAISPE